MYVQRFQIPITTDASGAAVAYSEVFSGLISTLIYTKHPTNPFDDGVDLTLTIESTGENVWTEANVNASKTVAPRQATHGNDGLPTLVIAGGEPVEDVLAVAYDRLKITVGQGGNTKQGTITLIVR